jgi:membrane dipeptidase
MRPPLIFDCHLDLSLNGLEYNRDLRRSVAEIRRREKGMADLQGRACGTVALPEMREASIGICVATLLAGCMQGARPMANWMSPEQAWAQTQGQLSWYRALEEAGEIRQIFGLEDLEAAVSLWTTGDEPRHKPICYVLSLEGADSIRGVGHLERAWEQGLRALGPAHYGVGRWALGHDKVGGLPSQGKELLKEMDRLGIILDVTHLSDGCFWDALDVYHGPIWASHSNCRSLAPDPRQFSDEQLKAIIERGGVIGCVLDSWMMVPGWIRGQTTAQEVGLLLEVLLDHMEHICQLAGNSNHVGLGSDLDGGYGTEQVPMDLDTIGDLVRLPEMLRQRGFSVEEAGRVLSGNFLDLLRSHWSGLGL